MHFMLQSVLTCTSCIQVILLVILYASNCSNLLVLKPSTFQLVILSMPLYLWCTPLGPVASQESCGAMSASGVVVVGCSSRGCSAVGVNVAASVVLDGPATLSDSWRGETGPASLVAIPVVSSSSEKGLSDVAVANAGALDDLSKRSTCFGLACAVNCLTSTSASFPFYVFCLFFAGDGNGRYSCGPSTFSLCFLSLFATVGSLLVATVFRSHFCCNYCSTYVIFGVVARSTQQSSLLY